jgi:8-oxo-dGTP diphosphatase
MHRFSANKQNPNVSVDCVIFGFYEAGLKLLLIERDYGTHAPLNPSGRDLLLPGDLINDDEDLDRAAKRVLFELTHLSDIYLEQFHAFGDPNRVKKDSDKYWLEVIRKEPQARVITVAYFSLVKPDAYLPEASSFAKRAEWFPVNQIPELAFDHNHIVEKALFALRGKLLHSAIAFELLPEKFTLGHLQRVYETILGKSLDKRNFRRKMLGKKMVKPLQEKQEDVPHKRAQLYSFDPACLATLNDSPEDEL